MLAVIATVVIVNGGDSASTSATVVVPPSRSASPRPSLVPVLPPETSPPSHRPRGQPSPTATSTAPTDIPPPAAVPSTPPDVAARTFVYRVTGTKGLLDLVTVVYTDAQGAPQTDFNVSLPWSRTVVLNPGVGLRSVVATQPDRPPQLLDQRWRGSARRHLDQQRDDRDLQPLGLGQPSSRIRSLCRR